MKWFATVTVGIGLGLALTCTGADEARVESLKVARHAASGLTVVGGQVNLPGKGVWTLLEPSPADSGLGEIVLEAPKEVYRAAMGERGQAILDERREREYRGILHAPYWTLAKWARAHEGRMPSLEDLDPTQKRSLERAFAALPVIPGILMQVPLAPHAALVPDSVFEFETPRYAGHDYVRGTNTAPLLVELHPLQDDGKHYVLHANAHFKRVAIDSELMAKLGVKVVPLQLNPDAGQYPERATYRLLAQQRKAADSLLSISNKLTGAVMQVHCPNFVGATDGGPDLLRDWGKRREGMWAYLAESYDAPGVGPGPGCRKACCPAASHPSLSREETGAIVARRPI